MELVSDLLLNYDYSRHLLGVKVAFILREAFIFHESIHTFYVVDLPLTFDVRERKREEVLQYFI